MKIILVSPDVIATAQFNRVDAPRSERVPVMTPYHAAQLEQAQRFLEARRAYWLEQHISALAHVDLDNIPVLSDADFFDLPEFTHHL